MSDYIIKVENLGKKYRIQHQGERESYVALRDVIARSATAPLRWLRNQTSAFRSQTSASNNGNGTNPHFASSVNSSRPAHGALPSTATSSDPADVRPLTSDIRPLATEDFWALRDVSFEVKPGEVVGIIGRNGAGKSTLLKILSRITEPTEGRVRLRGRVASLLEVGTGFHPELTGRENIFVNGAILGMTRAEIAKKFDEIVAFAEIEKFLDTPVKRYSSGMYVRLAFAVAAHLEPEILIVDEVLAVGDVLFQEKCLGKIREVSRSGGRTVIFVSHNMGAIQSLCDWAIVLEQGREAFRGKALDAVRFYFRKADLQAEVEDLANCLRTGTGEARVLSVRLEDDAGAPQVQFSMGEALTVVVKVNFSTEVQNPIFGVNIVTDTGIMVADCRSSHYGLKLGNTKGTVEYRMRIESVALYPRNYMVEPWVTDVACLSVFDWVRNAATFLVTSGPNFVSGANVNADHGISFIPTLWTVGKI